LILGTAGFSLTTSGPPWPPDGPPVCRLRGFAGDAVVEVRLFGTIPRSSYGLADAAARRRPFCWPCCALLASRHFRRFVVLLNAPFPRAWASVVSAPRRCGYSRRTCFGRFSRGPRSRADSHSLVVELSPRAPSRQPPAAMIFRCHHSAVATRSMFRAGLHREWARRGARARANSFRRPPRRDSSLPLL